MPSIPLALQAYRRQANFQPEVEAVNVFLEKDDSGASPDKLARIMRPGLSFFGNNDLGDIRGVYRQANFLVGTVFHVASGMLFRSYAPIGFIDGSGIVAWAPGVGSLYILGGNTLHRTDGFTVDVVPLPDDATGVPVDIDTLNSYVFITCSDATIYWIVPGETTIDPLNFVTAESSPDGLIAGRRLESEIFFMGQDSVEPWQLTGDPNAPVQKAIGRQYEIGIKSRDTLRRFDNSLVWVDDVGRVVRASAQPEVICDEGLAERIRKATGNLSAFTISFDNHEMYVLRIPGQGSFTYDAAGRNWCRWKSAGIVEWAPHVAISDTLGTLLGSAINPRLWTLSPDLATDEGVNIEWKVTGTVAMIGRPQRNDSMSIGVGCDRDCTIRVRWHDAREDYPDYYEELEARSPVDMVNLYRMGSIQPPYRTFEVSGNDGARIRISGAATETWQ